MIPGPAAIHSSTPHYLVAPTQAPRGFTKFVDKEIGSAAPEMGPGVPTGLGSDPFGDMVTPRLPEAAPPPVKRAPVAQAPVGPLSVSSGVQAAKLLFGPKPAYPALAKAARVQGTVKIQAIIAADGTIGSLQVMSGPPLLIAAAKEAVSRWRYQATLLNGRAVEVITEIDVIFTLGNWLILSIVLFLAQQAQNPSPMVEHTRPHPRLEKPVPDLAGRREQLAVGRLFIPAKLSGRRRVPLFVHFHGIGWVAELAAEKNASAAITVETGSGSGVYAKQFSDHGLFGKMVQEASEKAGVTFDPITLTCWSAGHGAIREILQTPEDYARVGRVILIDGLHTGYTDGKPGPLESKLDADHLDVFLKFARDAVAGRKSMVITHSEIFPGTFASTTETTDWILEKLGLKRRALVRNGPMGTQQLSEVRAGRFVLVGFAGNSAPDHVDQFHSLGVYLSWLR
jgi:TonB family protein